MQDGITPKLASRSNVSEWTDRSVFSDRGGLIDECQGMDTGRRLRSSIEYGERSGEIEIWIGRNEAGYRQVLKRLRHKDRPCLRILYFVRIFRVCQKRELRAAGLLHARDAGDLQGCVAMISQPTAVRDFAQFHALQCKSAAIPASDTRRRQLYCGMKKSGNIGSWLQLPFNS